MKRATSTPTECKAALEEGRAERDKGLVTKRPWSYSEHYDRYRGLNTYSIDQFSSDVVLPCQKANAEFIVKAVNAHDSLIAALEMFADMIEDDKILTTTENREELIQALTMANEALKLAKGE